MPILSGGVVSYERGTHVRLVMRGVPVDDFRREDCCSTACPARTTSDLLPLGMRVLHLGKPLNSHVVFYVGQDI